MFKSFLKAREIFSTQYNTSKQFRVSPHVRLPGDIFYPHRYVKIAKFRIGESTQTFFMRPKDRTSSLWCYRNDHVWQTWSARFRQCVQYYSSSCYFLSNDLSLIKYCCIFTYIYFQFTILNFIWKLSIILFLLQTMQKKYLLTQ